MSCGKEKESTQQSDFSTQPKKMNRKGRKVANPAVCVVTAGPSNFGIVLEFLCALCVLCGKPPWLNADC